MGSARLGPAVAVRAGMRSRVVMAATFGVAMLAATAASGQQDTDVPPLHAGRPGITESAGVAGPRVIQFEGGLELDASPESRAWSETFLSPAVLRVGLTPRFELRLAGDGLTVDDGPAAHDRGMADLTVGAKYILLDADRAGLVPGPATGKSPLATAKPAWTGWSTAASPAPSAATPRSTSKSATVCPATPPTGPWAPAWSSGTSADDTRNDDGCRWRWFWPSR
jgi:hypothetical protein